MNRKIKLFTSNSESQIVNDVNTFLAQQGSKIIAVSNVSVSVQGHRQFHVTVHYNE